MSENNAVAVMSVPQSVAGCPELARALAQAIQQAGAVPKDSFNTFHRYRYASAEAIIAEARGPLAECGLSLVPIEQVLSWHTEGEGRCELNRRFLLLHTSGECLPVQTSWPVVPEKGRPVDKALAIAATTSLAYLLRDLLQLPRVDGGEDVAARQDRQQSAPQQPTKEAFPAALAMPAAPAVPAAPSSVAARPPGRINNEQKDAIDSLTRGLQITADQFAQRLVQLFGFGDPGALDEAQAALVIRKLEERKAAQPAGVSA